MKHEPQNTDVFRWFCCQATLVEWPDGCREESQEEEEEQNPSNCINLSSCVGESPCFFCWFSSQFTLLAVTSCFGSWYPHLSLWDISFPPLCTVYWIDPYPDWVGPACGCSMSFCCSCCSYRIGYISYMIWLVVWNIFYFSRYWD